jgi:hypothetical protein
MLKVDGKSYFFLSFLEQVILSNAETRKNFHLIGGQNRRKPTG